MSKMEGTYLVTNMPEAEKSYGMYGKDSYVILQSGAKARDVEKSIVYKKINKKFKISGIDQEFSSVYLLIQHFKQNPLPESGKTLVEPLPACKRCRRCSSRSGENNHDT